MDYWYLGMLVIAVIVGIIYMSRRGSTGMTIQNGDTISEMPILFGYSDELRVWRSGKLLILQNKLVIIDDNNNEQLRLPIDQTLQIALRTYDPFQSPFWDIVDPSARTFRFKTKTSFSPFYMNAIADRNERLLHTIHQITGTEIVRVSAIAQPSFMRVFEIVRWVVLGSLVILFVYLYSQNRLF